MTTEELGMKEWIDQATYKSLLCKWRFEPSGSPWFEGEIGQYYAKVLKEKRELDPNNAINASKEIGW